VALEVGASQFSYLYSATLTDALESIAAMGFTHVELLTMPPHLHAADEEAWPNVKATIARLGLRPVAVGPMYFDLNLASTNPAVRLMSVEEVIANVRLAAELGAPNVVVSAGRRNPLFPAPLELAWDLATDSLGRCLKSAEQYGVTLCLEPLPYSFLDTGVAVRTMLDQVASPHLRAVLDTANSHSVEGVVAATQALAGHIAHVQMSDTIQGAFRHDAIGKGEIDFRTALQALAAARFEGPVILELCEPDDANRALADSLARIRELAPAVPRPVHGER
jgi:sugar phosphate isomerase/epimerase